MPLNRAVRAALAAAALLCAAAAPANAKTFVVHRGHSIQAAIDKAKPGDTVVVTKGTYREALLITKNRIRLRGVHATLTEPATPTPNSCDQVIGESGHFTGICIVGKFTPPSTPEGQPTIQSTVKDVRVSGFTVKGFSGNGVFIFASRGAILQNDRLVGNGSYGAFSNTSTGTQYLRDLAKGNHAPGLYIGDSPKARAFVHQSRSINNDGEGILLRDASVGRVTDNVLQGNCAGVLVLADAPGPAGNWKISGNRVLKNNRACAGDPAEGEPPLSGIGIGLFGAHDTLVNLNQVLGNKAGNPSPLGTGGILVGKGPQGTAPKADTVLSNTAEQNTPFDIAWDGSGTAKFTSNHCTKGKPSRVCKR